MSIAGRLVAPKRVKEKRRPNAVINALTSLPPQHASWATTYKPTSISDLKADSALVIRGRIQILFRVVQVRPGAPKNKGLMEHAIAQLIFLVTT